MAHSPRKRFGQNFLVDESVVEAIVRAIAPAASDHIVEIGPGMSALTAPLLRRLEHLTVIEIDRDLVRRLAASYPPERLRIIESDVLKVDFSQLAPARPAMPRSTSPGALRVVGNLPYNISTPLLFHLVQYAGYIRDQHFMLQREVVDRMVAKPSTSDYSRLSVMLQWHYRIDKLFDVPPEAFDPPPRVVSSVVRMRPLGAARLQPQNEALFTAVVARAFSQRRKMLRRVLADWTKHIQWQALGAPETARAEELSLQQFIALADQLHQAGIQAPKA